MLIQFGKVRAAAAERRETAQDLAVVLGINERLVRDRLAERRRWTVAELVALADHWDMSLDDLVGRELERADS